MPDETTQQANSLETHFFSFASRHIEFTSSSWSIDCTRLQDGAPETRAEVKGGASQASEAVAVPSAGRSVAWASGVVTAFCHADLSRSDFEVPRSLGVAAFPDSEAPRNQSVVWHLNTVATAAIAVAPWIDSVVSLLDSLTSESDSDTSQPDSEASESDS